jgi:hypothetical protein
MKKQIKTIEEVNEVIKKLDNNIEINSEAFKVAQILLTALIVGPNRNKIAKFTGLSKDFIYKTERKLKASGVWKNNKTCCEWFDKESGGVAFWCDVSVGLGYLKRQ